MNTLFALQRANGDWFALDDEGLFRVPIFRNSAAAMVARSRDFGMECFRPVALDDAAFENLTTTDEGKACFWLVDDPSMNLRRGQSLDRNGLEQFMRHGAGRLVTSEVTK